MTIETPASISSIALATGLNRLASLRGVRAFWAEAISWLRELTAAEAVHLLYLGARHIRLTEGDMSGTVITYLEEWEKRWFTSPTLPQEGVQGVHVTNEYLTSDNKRLIQFPLVMEGGSRGAITFVFPPHEGELVYHPTFQTVLRTLASMALLQDNLAISQERLDQLLLFYQIGQNLASSLDLQEVLREIIELTTVVLNAEAATLFLLDEERHELVFAIPTGEKGALLQEFRIPADQGVAGWVVATGQPALINDVRSDPRFLQKVDTQTGFVTRNLLCVPLQYRGRIIGALETLNKQSPHGFTSEDLYWLTTMAAQAAVAVENARLYESLRQERDRIIAVQEDVRHRLARALHDGPAQDLARVLLDLDYARKLLEKRPEQLPDILNEIENLVRRTNRDIRQFLFELRPVILETRGLVAALKYYIRQWQEEEGLACELEVRDFPEVDTQVAGIIFSIVQEAFNNLRKHARAQHVWIRLLRDGDVVRVEIEDDGVGFDVKQVLDQYDERNSFGLLNMREQAELLDGRLTFLSPSPRLQRGTLVRVEFPYERVKRAR
ncbi:MAG: GAF domain-containing sensor histidine kinase [Chloroflexi bacterium]|nr:GAF domain-containing sensor histidine kinase [Chloroflexota bacterium]